MDPIRKKQLKKVTTWVLLAALVATLTAMPLLAKADVEADGPVATVHSGTVEEGSVRTTLRGGGTLSTEGIEEITLPTDVKITEFLTKNGETVTAGTPLAAVDKVSVMTAITSVTETMEYLQEEMKTAKNETVDSTITARAGGRVKEVYAKKGDSVQDVMLREGALALLSLDGLMAVKIEKKLDILTGDTVTVTLADETAVTGRIASNLDGEIVITVEDQGYEIGQSVTVTGKDGAQIGTGELYVHNAWTATAYSGIIQTVYAREETKVSAGATLFSLTETDFQGKLSYLSALHREYEELLQELFQMYHSGTIDAPCDGLISGIDKDSPHLLAAQTEEALTADLLTAREGQWTLVLLSDVVYDPAPQADVCNPDLGDSCPATSHDPNCLKSCQRNTTCTATGQHYSECIKSCSRADSADQCSGTKHHYSDCIKSCVSTAVEGNCPSLRHYTTCIEYCTSSDGTQDCRATGKHKASCIESCTHADTADQCSASIHHYPDCIKCCITSDSGSHPCPASKHNDNCFFAAMTYRAKVAIVTAVGSSQLVVRWDASGQEYEVEKTATGWKFVANPDFNVDLLVSSGPNVTVSNPSAYQVGDVIFVITGYKGNQAEWSGISVFMRASSVPDLDLDISLDGLTDYLTDMITSQLDLSALLGQFNFGFYAPSVVEEEKLFDLEGSCLMTVSPQETASLTIELDEQDIAMVSVGQKATVKVEALKGESFEAVVTEVSAHGVNRGGSSKFTVKLELPKAKDMLDGMSATAALPLQEKEGVPTIAVIALAEEGNQTVVYTALDKEGNPATPVPVTIGLSDGITAEILSGLSLGDTYYYSYYDVLELDTGVEDRFTLS